MLTREEFNTLSKAEQEKLFRKAFDAAKDKFSGEVFQVSGVYFALGNDSIYEVPDVSATPRPVPLVLYTGPTDEQKEAAELLMDRFEFDVDTFLCLSEDLDPEVFDWNDDFTLDLAAEEDEEAEEAAEIIKRVRNYIAKGITVFNNMDDLVNTIRRLDVEHGPIYYEWDMDEDDDPFLLIDAIFDGGDEYGTHDSLTLYEWLEVLENLENYRVVL